MRKMIKTVAASAAAVLLLSSCNGVGGGNKLETLRIAQDLTKTAEEETSAKAFTCLPSPLILVGTFNKGDAGNFSSRAHWTSDDESIVKVTNRLDPVPNHPGELYLQGGILIPQETTTERSTIVRAEYLGLKAQMTVVVRPSTDLRIIPAVARVIPQSFQRYLVRAKLDGVETDITNLTELTFAAPNDDVATIGTEAQIQIVRGVTAGGPFTIVPNFEAPCDSQAPSATVTIADIPPGGLVLDYEQGYGAQLAEGTSEILNLRVRFGDFGDGAGGPPDGDMDDEGEFQVINSQASALFGYDADNDGQCELLLEDPGTVAAPNPTPPIALGGLLAGLNVLSAVRDTDTTNGSTKICASFGPTPDPDGTGPLTASNGTLSNVLPLEIVDAALSSFTLTASDACDPDLIVGCEPLVPAPDPNMPSVEGGKTIKLTAVGTFAGGYVQNITKDITYVSSKPTLVGVSAGVTSTAGFLVTAADPASLTDVCDATATSCSAIITATWNAGTAETTDDVTREITVTVQQPPDDAATP